ncbi:hypothetical protein QJQ45_025344, partial [Haematococcus lacustris]
ALTPPRTSLSGNTLSSSFGDTTDTGGRHSARPAQATPLTSTLPTPATVLAPLKGPGLNKLAPLGSASASPSTSASDWSFPAPALDKVVGVLGASPLPAMAAGLKPVGGLANGGMNMVGLLSPRPSSSGTAPNPLPLQLPLQQQPGVQGQAVAQPDTVAQAQQAKAGQQQSRSPSSSSTTATPLSSTSERQRLQSEFEAECAQLRAEQRQRLSELRAELEREERAAQHKLTLASKQAMEEFKRHMESKAEREREEVVAVQRKQLDEVEAAHKARLDALRAQQQEVEAKLQQQVKQQQQELERARSQSGQAIEEEEKAAAVWAEGQRTSLRQLALDKVLKEVEAEVAPLKAARMEAACGQLDEQAAAAVALRRQEVSALEEGMAAKRAAAAALDQALAEQRAKARVLEEELAPLEAEVRAKQQERASLDRDFAVKSAEFDDLISSLRAKQRELAAATTQADELKASQVAGLTSELQRQEYELGVAKASLASVTDKLAVEAAQRHSSAEKLAEVTAELETKTAALAQLQHSLAAKQEELASVSAELVRGRMDFMTRVGAATPEQAADPPHLPCLLPCMTLPPCYAAHPSACSWPGRVLWLQDISLAGELRSKAASEHASLEQDLTRRAASGVQPQLSVMRSLVVSCMPLEVTSLLVRQELAIVHHDLAQRRGELRLVQPLVSVSIGCWCCCHLCSICMYPWWLLSLGVFNPSAAAGGPAAEQESLSEVTADLVDKQRRSAATAVELSNVQAELGKAQTSLGEQQRQLAAVASQLLACRQELDYQQQRTALSSEQVVMLATARARMERAVEEEVEAERGALLARKTAAMQVDVARQVEQRRASAASAAAAATQAISPSAPLSPAPAAPPPSLPHNNPAGAAAPDMQGLPQLQPALQPTGMASPALQASCAGGAGGAVQEQAEAADTGLWHASFSRPSLWPTQEVQEGEQQQSHAGLLNKTLPSDDVRSQQPEMQQRSNEGQAATLTPELLTQQEEGSGAVDLAAQIRAALAQTNHSSQLWPPPITTTHPPWPNAASQATHRHQQADTTGAREEGSKQLADNSSAYPPDSQLPPTSPPAPPQPLLPPTAAHHSGRVSQSGGAALDVGSSPTGAAGSGPGLGQGPSRSLPPVLFTAGQGVGDLSCSLVALESPGPMLDTQQQQQPQPQQQQSESKTQQQLQDERSQALHSQQLQQQQLQPQQQQQQLYAQHRYEQQPATQPASAASQHPKASSRTQAQQQQQMQQQHLAHPTSYPGHQNHDFQAMDRSNEQSADELYGSQAYSPSSAQGHTEASDTDWHSGHFTGRQPPLRPQHQPASQTQAGHSPQRPQSGSSMAAKARAFLRQQRQHLKEQQVGEVVWVGRVVGGLGVGGWGQGRFLLVHMIRHLTVYMCLPACPSPPFQALIAHAVQNWRATVAGIEQEPSADRRAQQMAMLRSVKEVLEEETRRCNAGKAQLASLKAQVRALETASLGPSYTTPHIASHPNLSTSMPAWSTHQPPSSQPPSSHRPANTAPFMPPGSTAPQPRTHSFSTDPSRLSSPDHPQPLVRPSPPPDPLAATSAVQQVLRTSLEQLGRALEGAIAASLSSPANRLTSSPARHQQPAQRSSRLGGSMASTAALGMTELSSSRSAGSSPATSPGSLPAAPREGPGTTRGAPRAMSTGRGRPDGPGWGPGASTGWGQAPPSAHLAASHGGRQGQGSYPAAASAWMGPALNGLGHAGLREVQGSGAHAAPADPSRYSIASPAYKLDGSWGGDPSGAGQRGRTGSSGGRQGPDLRHLHHAPPPPRLQHQAGAPTYTQEDTTTPAAWHSQPLPAVPAQHMPPSRPPRRRSSRQTYDTMPRGWGPVARRWSEDWPGPGAEAERWEQAAGPAAGYHPGPGAHPRDPAAGPLWVGWEGDWAPAPGGEGEGQDNGWGGGLQVGAPGSLEFLDRWQDERDVVESLLHQHSSWLRTFRDQVWGAGGRRCGSWNLEQPRWSFQQYSVCSCSAGTDDR